MSGYRSNPNDWYCRTPRKEGEKTCEVCGKPTPIAEGSYVDIDKYHRRWVCHAKCKPVLEQKLREAI